MPKYLKQEVPDLNAEPIFTVHNAKYALARHSWDEPLKNAETLATKIAPKTVLLPKIGEVVWLH